LLRIALTPFVVLAILSSDYTRALLLCMLAGATDGVDGYLARRFDWKTRLGSYLDPIADKSMLVLVYLALGMAGAIPMWLMVLVLGRDVVILLMALGALAFTTIRDFPPSWWGKVSTTIQMCSAVAFMCARAWPVPFFQFFVPVGIVLTTLGTVWSGVHYLRTAIQRLRQSSAEGYTRS
jgi:cardiolipin synthase